jgi:GntR family transcriptional regulator, colanic acid and biofilm gene transcriptional regulator
MPKLTNHQTKKLSTSIHKELQELLIAGHFAPGERIKVNDMAEQTGTSITPVREALLRLVSENAIEMYSPRSFAVPSLSLQRYREIREMRVALEGLAAEHATDGISNDDIEVLERTHERFVEAERTKRPKDALKANRKFHFTVYQNAKMPIVLASIEILWAMMGPILNVFYGKMRTDYVGAEEHLNLIVALKHKKAKAAGDAMRADILRGVASIEAYIKAVEGSAKF